jgi:hypothetical protein
MKFFNFKKKTKIDVRPGQVSEDSDSMTKSIGKLSSFYGITSPKFPLEHLAVLEMLSIWNPDISQALSIIVNLSNTGHTIEVDSKKPDFVLDRINSQAKNIYRTGGGVDGLINHLIRQVALMGALSGEWVIHDNVTNGVKGVVIPPVRTIRFKKVDGEFKPFQKTSGSFQNSYIELNPFTYSYSPIQTMDGNPYGVPTFYAVLKNIETQLNAIGGFSKIIKKMGILGFTDVAMDIPDQVAGESSAAFRSRLQKRLTDYAKAYENGLSQGVAVHYKDQEIKHNSISGTAGAAAKIIFNLNEEQIFSGMDIPPSMAGRSYSTTETYAGVDYKRLQKRLSNYKRTVKRFIEKGYILDLNLMGIDADVSLKFNSSLEFKEDERANREGKQIDNVIKKNNAGFISDDEAAQELGYEKATGEKEPPKETVSFGFDAEKEKYIFIPKKLPEILSKKKDFKSSYAKDIAALLRGVENKAALSIKDLLSKKLRPEAFAKKAYEAFSKSFSKAVNSSKTAKTIKSYTEDAWQFHRFEDKNFSLISTSSTRLRIEKRDLSVTKTIDNNALRYIQSVDKHYFGSGNYLADNTDVASKLISWLRDEYIAKGLSLKDDKTYDEFVTSFQGVVKNTSWQKIEQLVDTTMGRIQNMGQSLRLYEAGFKSYEIVGPKTKPACDYCINMVGRVFDVEISVQRLGNIVGKGFEDVKDLPPFITNYSIDDLEGMSDKALQKAGFDSPPFHPMCRHRKAALD